MNKIRVDSYQKLAWGKVFDSASFLPPFATSTWGIEAAAHRAGDFHAHLCLISIGMVEALRLSGSSLAINDISAK